MGIYMIKHNILLKNKIDTHVYEYLERIFDVTCDFEYIKTEVGCRLRYYTNKLHTRLEFKELEHTKYHKEYDISINKNIVGKYLKKDKMRYFQIGQSFIRLTENSIEFNHGVDFTAPCINREFINIYNLGIIRDFIICIQKNADVINNNIKFEFDYEFIEKHSKKNKRGEFVLLDYRIIKFDKYDISLGEWQTPDENLCYDSYFVKDYKSNWIYWVVKDTPLEKRFELEYDELYSNYHKMYKQHINNI